MGQPTVTAVITAHDRRQFLVDAVRSAVDSGADEVVVVRNFLEPIPGFEGRYRDVRCDARETGVKQARGVEAATGDLVAFLDDDDVWENSKVPAIREIFGRAPDLVYFGHAQRAINASGELVTASHPELVGRVPEEFPTTDRNDFRRLAEHVWPANNSSTVILREWSVTWLPRLCDAGWACDLFWFVAALLSGRGLRLSSEPLVRLRLHDQNMSQTRGAQIEDFRRRHGESSERFARAYRTMAHVADEHLGPGSAMAVYLEERSVDFDFFAKLDSDARARPAAWNEVLHGSGLRRKGILGAALVALVSPAASRRLLFRASQQRWRLQ